MIGVHSPEFEHERPRESAEAAVRRHRLEYPQLLDEKMTYWNALGNEYWPTTYLVDRCGRIRARHIGEIHEGEGRARDIEAEIAALLAESAEGCPP